MHRLFFRTASILAAVAVVFGAFGAHLLKKYLPVDDLTGYHTAVGYQMTHALGIFIAGIIYRFYRSKGLIWAGYCFMLGIMFFSGSIYLRLLFNYLQLDWGRIVIMFAPLGGTLFALGWIFILFSIPSRKQLSKKTDEEA
jgi:uncharacterized membrane protein YgdD (TMEM256/DUF423 family)